MLQSWFEDEEPTPEEAKRMVSAVMEALLRSRPEQSLSHFTRAIAIGDSLGAPIIQADSYRFRGRA